MNPAKITIFFTIGLLLPLMTKAGDVPSGKLKAFGQDGTVLTRIGDRGTQGKAVAVQRDGKIVVAGQAQIGEDSVIVLVRYKPNGSTDRSFGNAGHAILRSAEGPIAAAAVALQADGRIVVAGYPYNQSRAAGFIAARYHSNGYLDHSFGNQGIVTAALGDIASSANCLALQNNGKILLGGQVAVGSKWVFGLIRLNTSGSIDSSFGSGGSVLTDFGGGDSVATGIAIQPDRKILVAGTTFNGVNSDFAVARYDLNGNLDTTFGDGGLVNTIVGYDFDSNANCMKLDTAGRILLAGWSIPSLSPDTNMDLSIARLAPTGLPDPTFGNNGVLLVDGAQEQEAAWDIALQRDGRILVTSSANYDFTLLRILPHGGVDGSFGQGGLWQLDFDSDADEPSGLALGAEGEIFVTGFANWGNVPYMALWRVKTPGRCPR